MLKAKTWPFKGVPTDHKDMRTLHSGSKAQDKMQEAMVPVDHRAGPLGSKYVNNTYFGP